MPPSTKPSSTSTSDRSLIWAASDWSTVSTPSTPWTSGALTQAHDRKISPCARSQAEQRGVCCAEAYFTTLEIAAEIGPVDAVLLFDILLQPSAPTGTEVLAYVCPRGAVLGVASPQWEPAEESVRLLDLGRERFLDVVPPGQEAPA